MFVNLHDFIAGCIGGVFGLFVGHPGDTVKVRQQNYGTTMWFAIKSTFVHEGMFGFYKGMLLPTLAAGPGNALFFGVYGNCLQYLQNTHTTRARYDDPSWKEKVYLAGCAGGLAIVISTCPVELVKIVLQSNTEGKGKWKKSHVIERKTKMWPCMKNIYKQEGILGLYRGFVPMLYRDVPSYGIYTLTYEVLMHKTLTLSYSDVFLGCDIIRQIFSGGIAGVLSWIFIMPFDLVKSRMQADNPEKPLYKGMTDCFYKSYKADGITIFNKGILVTLCRAFPVNAATFTAYEGTLQVLRGYF